MAKRQQPTVLSKKHLDRMHREQQQTRWILIGSAVILAIVILVIIYGVLDQNVLRYQRAVAEVNGERISAGDFRSYTKYYRYNIIQNAQSTYQIASMFGNDPNMLQQFLGQLSSAEAQLEPEKAAENSLNLMVDNTLVRQEAEKQGITVSDEEVEERMHEVLNYFPNGTPTPTSTKAPIPTSTLSPTQIAMMKPTATATLTVTQAVTATTGVSETTPAETTPVVTEEATAAPDANATATPVPTEAPPTATPTPYTLEGYKSAYATMMADFKTNYEIPEETLRYIIKHQILREKLQAKVIGDIPCTQEQVWAQHILVADAALAKTIQEKVAAGEDWFTLASTYSTDTSNKDNGGDLGWFSRGRMVKEFEDAAFGMQIGEVSGPIQSQFGYHIIRVLGHEDRPLTASECSQMKDEKFQTWLNDLRTNSKVQLLDYWKEIYPLLPTMPAEITDVLRNAAAASQNQAVPQPTAIP